MTREHFIPFRKTDIVTMCADELDAAERDSFREFAKLLARLLHQRFYDRLEALKDAYHPFNPESDTRHLSNLDAVQKEAARARLEEELRALAVAANFIEIDPAEFEQAFSAHSLLKVGLSVDLKAVDKLMVFRRGESEQTREIRTWFGLRREMVRFTNYARVLVYAAFKDAGPRPLIIKLFQNVPREDLEMVLPNVQVRMRGIDKLLIGIPAFLSGIIVIVTKLIASIGLIILLIGFWLGMAQQPPPIDQTKLLALGAGLFAVGGYMVRQVSNFKNRKISFMKALSDNLYFRNLDNDAGVFHSLLDAAEEAEAIEALLAFHFLHLSAKPLSSSDLDGRVEAWFAQRWAERVDFEVEDGVRKLRELSLVSMDGDGRMSAVSLDEAARKVAC
jgi:hypothetical protein